MPVLQVGACQPTWSVMVTAFPVKQRISHHKVGVVIRANTKVWLSTPNTISSPSGKNPKLMSMDECEESLLIYMAALLSRGETLAVEFAKACGHMGSQLAMSTDPMQRPLASQT